MEIKTSVAKLKLSDANQIGCNVTLLGDVEICGNVPAQAVKKIFGSLCNGN